MEQVPTTGSSVTVPDQDSGDPKSADDAEFDMIAAGFVTILGSIPLLLTAQTIVATRHRNDSLL
jgi:hypothetical protein